MGWVPAGATDTGAAVSGVIEEVMSGSGLGGAVWIVPV
jgi:hypothetical protein